MQTNQAENRSCESSLHQTIRYEVRDDPSQIKGSKGLGKKTESSHARGAVESRCRILQAQLGHVTWPATYH
jgi:hypothetical protein